MNADCTFYQFQLYLVTFCSAGCRCLNEKFPYQGIWIERGYREQ